MSAVVSRRHRPARAVLGVATVIAVIAVVVAVLIGGGSLLDRLRPDEPVAVEADEPTIVQASMRDLTETFTAAGTLQFDEAIDVSAPTAGTLLDVVGVGQSVSNGDVLAVIDDRAVVWLDGEVPAWRALAEGDQGVDVFQLETALTALGFDADGSVSVDEDYTSATASMVAAWQASLGVAETGRIEAGTIVFGGDRNRIASVEVAVGDSVAPGTALGAIGTSRRLATLEATPSEAVTLAVGDDVELELPDRTTIDGSVRALTPDDDTWVITVGFEAGAAFPRADVANVEMVWTHTIASDVVTIPSAALLRLDDGSYTVEVVNDDASTTRVPVEIGVAVGTRVEVVSGLAGGVSIVTI